MSGADIEAVFFDGVSARRRPVSLRLDGDAVEIHEGGAALAAWPIAAWPIAALRRIDAPETLVRLTDGAASLARLEIAADAAGARVFAAVPYLRPRVLGAGATARIVAWTAAAAISLVLCAVYLVPAIADRAAPLVPDSVDRRLGAAVDRRVRILFGNKACANRAGTIALGMLVGKLVAAGGDGVPPLTVVVLDTPIPNAFALPGGRIFLLSGLLAKAKSPDEVAGVIAHEIGHVVHRDGLRAMLRVGGTSALLGLLVGDIFGTGAVIAMAQVAIEGVSSREAEREADRHARDTLLALGRPPQALATILSRIASQVEAAIPPFLRSHPLTAERLTALSGQPQREGAPLLEEDEWDDLQEICSRP